MSAHAINLVSLPNEILFITTEHIIDPCDLLALRLSHSVFNNLLQNRFNSTFRNTPYTKRRYKKPTLDAVLFWAARHNYVRFAKKILGLVGRRGKSLRDGQRNSLTDNGRLQAACEAVRNGHSEMFLVFSDVTNESDHHTCFEVAVSEGNVETAKVVMEHVSLYEWIGLVNEEGVGPLLLLMKTHEVELVELWIEILDVYSRESGEALMEYAESLQEHEEGWCQKIVLVVLQNVLGYSKNLFETDELFDLLQKAEKRECGSECWKYEVQDIGMEELKYEVRLLQGLE